MHRTGSEGGRLQEEEDANSGDDQFAGGYACRPGIRQGERDCMSG